MKINITFIFLMLSVFSIHAQSKITLSLKGGIGHYFNYNSSSVIEGERYSFRTFLIDENKVIRDLVRSKTKYNYQFSSKPSGYLGVDVGIDLFEGFSIVTGLDLTYMKFEHNLKNITTIYRTVLDTDTISTTTPSFPGVVLCGTPPPKPYYLALSIGIPLEMRISVFAWNKTWVNIGGYLRIPVYAKYNQVSLNANCIMEHRLVNTDYINRLWLGAKLGVEQQIGDRFSIELGAKKVISSIVESNNFLILNSASQSSKEDYSPISVFLGLKYKIWQGNIVNTSRILSE